MASPFSFNKSFIYRLLSFLICCAVSAILVSPFMPVIKTG
jgi:hypothetical protein